MKMNVKNVVQLENLFIEIPSAYRAEGWALDKNGNRYRVGYIQDIWWYEEGGFRAYRIYCDKKYIEKNLMPITRLRAIKSATMNFG